MLNQLQVDLTLMKKDNKNIGDKELKYCLLSLENKSWDHIIRYKHAKEAQDKWIVALQHKPCYTKSYQNASEE